MPVALSSHRDQRAQQDAEPADRPTVVEADQLQLHQPHPRAGRPLGQHVPDQRGPRPTMTSAADDAEDAAHRRDGTLGNTRNRTTD